jgi:RNA polymerase sigma-70 factor (ECF subfamily)
MQTCDFESTFVRLACAGDEKAFAWLYRRYFPRLYRLCVRMTRDEALAEDCVQEAFFNAWRALSRFQSRSTFGTWLHRIAFNVALHKQREHSWFNEPLVLEEYESSAWTYDTTLEEHELVQKIESLPERMGEVLVFAGIWGYSHQETAQMLGIPEGASKTHLHRARRRISEYIEANAA